jgi:hypothetical protein
MATNQKKKVEDTGENLLMENILSDDSEIDFKAELANLRNTTNYSAPPGLAKHPNFEDLSENKEDYLFDPNYYLYYKLQKNPRLP